MLRKSVVVGLLASLILTACTADSGDDRVAKTPQSICLNALAANNGRLAENDCRAACELDPADRTSCGAIALAGLQSAVEEVSTYVSFLQPAQSPGELVAAAQAEYAARYDTLVDARPLVNQFLGGLIRSLRAIREGVYLSVGGGEPVDIRIDRLPLDPRLLSIIYGRADSLSIKGHWTDKELATVGAAANAVLSLLDMVMAQDLNVGGVGTGTFNDMNGVTSAIAIVGEILNDNPELLLVDTPASLALARDEFHAALSLLAGRENTKEGVAQATPGLLGIIQADFEADARLRGPRPADPRVFKLIDVDGDKTLSRGDNFVVVLGINGEDVTLGGIYPISATLTNVIFNFLKEGNANMDGSKLPAKVAPIYNSVIKELGIFAAMLDQAGINTDTMPDFIGLDYKAFFDKFTGIRRLLPHWYHDDSTSGVNKFYFDGATVAENKRRIFLAYEEEVADAKDDTDAAHFEWAKDATEVTWNDGRKPTAINLLHPADGLQPAKGHYFLWQDPAFAGLLQVNTTPFVAYGMESALSTKDQFVTPVQSWMTNAVFNGFLVWWND